MATNFRTTSPAFIPSSKRRKGDPSETRVKRGARCVHGDKELLEKLGRKDACPCGSGRRFQELLHALRVLLTGAGADITSASEGQGPTSRKRREKWGTPRSHFVSRLGVRSGMGRRGTLINILGLPSAEALGYFRDAPPGLGACGFGGRALLQFSSAAEASHLSCLLARLKPCPDTNLCRNAF